MYAWSFWIAAVTAALAGSASAANFQYRALSCMATDGAALRIETDVERDSAGRPVTEDQGVARTANGLAWVVGTFGRTGDYYVFRFSGFTITVDRNGGSAFLRPMSGKAGLQLLSCNQVPPYQS